VVYLYIFNHKTFTSVAVQLPVWPPAGPLPALFRRCFFVLAGVPCAHAGGFRIVRGAAGM